MNNHRTTCDPERIELFLQQKLSDTEQTAFELHLDDCEDCRQQLEETAAGEDIWSGVRESLRDEPLTADFLRSGDSALDSATGEDHSSSQATVLKLLAPTDDDRMIGRWGMYEVVGVVGTGGMGVVLKALDAALNRYVAIKILAPHLGSSGAARKRFSREAQAAAAVVHDNVIEIYGVAETAGLPYLVMPYVRGPSLQRRLDTEGPLAVVEILRVGMQAASGLAAAHAQGLVHRDVKPANILLADGIERVKLTDFGLARAADDASLTKTGIIAGTPQYMSPEQARGESVDQRSDLFSLGSVLYAMCTGRAPFRAETSYGVLRRITDDEPRPIREINPEIPEWLCQVVAKLMSKRPDDRFQSAGEISGLLEECLAHVQQPTVVPLPANLPKPARKVAGTLRVPSALLRSWWPPVIRFKGAIAMIAAFGAGLLGVLMLSTAPPDIAGQWSGEDWGQVVLKKTSDSECAGTYSDTAGKQPGEIQLKWSRIERRFNGTWREGEDRFGELSVRLVGDEIRGALTTDAKSKVNPATPRLADLTWTRANATTTPFTSLNTLASAEFHYRVFEADAGLVDKLIPAAQRRNGVQPGVKFSVPEGEWSGSRSEGDFTVSTHGIVTTDPQLTEISPATLDKLLSGIGEKPGLLAEHTRTVSSEWWRPGLPEVQSYNILGRADGKPCGTGSVRAWLGFRHTGGQDEVRIEGALHNSVTTGPDAIMNLYSRFLYEGKRPQNEAMAFLVPFTRKDKSPHYLVAVYEIGKVNDAATPATAQQPSFGPVIERVLPNGSACTAQYFQFHKGEIVMVCKGPGMTNEEWARDWKKAEDAGGVDFTALWSDNGQVYLHGRGCIFSREVAPVVPGGDASNRLNWDKTTAEEVLTSMKVATSAGSIESSTRDLPVTYLFKTARGQTGIMQILGAVEEKRGDDGRGIKFRYKLVQTPATPASVERRTIDKLVSEFPEGLDLSTPEAACAAWYRAYAHKDAHALVDLSWPPPLDVKSVEQSYRDNERRDPEGAAIYLQAVADSKVVEVAILDRDLASVVTFLPFPAGKGASPYSIRNFAQIDGRWKNLGEDRAADLATARAEIDRKKDALRRQPFDFKGLVQSAATRAAGPVIERTLGPGGQHNICLDLETGRLHDSPDPKEVNPLNLAELRAWAAKEKIDVLFKEFLVGFDMAVFPMPDNRMWDNLPPADVLKVMEQATGATPAVIATGKELPVTVWFKTRKGTLGVLQVLGSTDLPPNGPRGVKIRYKLVKSGETKTATAQNPSFGPVIERTVNALDERDCFLNLEKGAIIEAECPLLLTWYEYDSEELRAWAEKVGADVVGAGQSGLWIFGGICYETEKWDEATAESVVKAVRALERRIATPIPAGNDPPHSFFQLVQAAKDATPTCVFKTRQGRMGILQITGSTEKPNGVKIRYKLVQGDATSMASSAAKVDSAEVNNAREKANQQSRRSELATILIAASAYVQQKGAWPEKLSELVNAHYLKGGGNLLLDNYLYRRPGPPKTVQEGNTQRYQYPAVLFEKTPSDQQGTWVGFADAHVEYITDMQRLKELGAPVPLPDNSAFRPVKRPTTQEDMVTVQCTTSRAARLQFRLAADEGDTSPCESLADPNDKTGQHPLRVRKEVLLDESAVAAASAAKSPNGFWEIRLQFNPRGAKLFAQITSANLRKQLAIVFDGKVLSAPIIQSSIAGGTAVITGNFTQAEAEAIASALNKPGEKTGQEAKGNETTVSTPTVLAEIRFISIPGEIAVDLATLDLAAIKKMEELAAIKKMGKVNFISAPKVIATSGRECEVKCVSGTAADALAPEPAGVIARLRPTLDGETVHYAVKFSIRMRQSPDSDERSTVLELARSGDAQLNQPVFMDIGKGGDGRRLLAWMVFRRVETSESAASNLGVPDPGATVSIKYESWDKTISLWQGRLTYTWATVKPGMSPAMNKGAYDWHTFAATLTPSEVALFDKWLKRHEVFSLPTKLPQPQPIPQATPSRLRVVQTIYRQGINTYEVDLAGRIVPENLTSAIAALDALCQEIRGQERDSTAKSGKAGSLHLDVGERLVKLGRFEEARTYYAKLLADDPQDAEVRHAMGAVLLRMGRKEEAATYLQKIDPKMAWLSATFSADKYAPGEDILIKAAVANRGQVSVAIEESSFDVVVFAGGEVRHPSASRHASYAAGVKTIALNPGDVYEERFTVYQRGRDKLEPGEYRMRLVYGPEDESWTWRDGNHVENGSVKHLTAEDVTLRIGSR